MTAVLALGSATFRQILARRRLVGLGLLGVLPALILWLTTGSLTGNRALDAFLDLGSGLLFGIVVPVTALILATSSLGDERRAGTLSFVTLRPINRFAIAGAKLAAAWGAAMVPVGLGAILLGAVHGMRSSDWSLLGPTLVGAAVAVFAYCALFVPFGHLAERAILIGLAYVFIWEGPVVGALAGLASLSPWRIGYSAFAGMVGARTRLFLPDFALGNLEPGLWGALAKVFVLGALSVGFIGLLFRHRDLA